MRRVFAYVNGSWRFISNKIDQVDTWNKRTVFGLVFVVVKCPKRYHPNTTELM